MMKKLKSSLMKPDQLKKRLQDPQFKKDFLSCYSNFSQSRDHSKHSRSKSPQEHLRPPQHPRKTNSVLASKENLRNLANGARPPSALRLRPSSKSTYLPTKPQSSSKRLSAMNHSHLMSVDSFSHPHDRSRYSSCNANDSISRQQRSVSNFSQAQIKKPPPIQISLRFGFRTRQGCQPNNKTKPNQDSILAKRIGQQKSTHIFAVADGHGSEGHLVSQFIIKHLSKLIDEAKEGLLLADRLPKMYEKIQKLLTESEINASCSGSTLVNVLLEEGEVICANVGDSRAILARESKTLEIQLTESAGK